MDQLLARTSSGGATAWYLPDKLGSVRDIVNTSGTVLDHVVYDSFGIIVTETNSANGDRFKYAGMEYDSVTGQYYDRARNYSSNLGRFINLDPAGFSAGDTNLLRYVGNNPTDETDPLGESSGASETSSESTSEEQGAQEAAVAAKEQAAYMQERTNLQNTARRASIDDTNKRAFQNEQITIWGIQEDDANKIYSRELTQATQAEILYNNLALQLGESDAALKFEVAEVLQNAVQRGQAVASTEVRVGLEVKINTQKRQMVQKRDMYLVDMMIQRIEAQQALARLDWAIAVRQMWIRAQMAQTPPAVPAGSKSAQ